MNCFGLALLLGNLPTDGVSGLSSPACALKARLCVQTRSHQLPPLLRNIPNCDCNGLSVSLPCGLNGKALYQRSASSNCRRSSAISLAVKCNGLSVISRYAPYARLCCPTFASSNCRRPLHFSLAGEVGGPAQIITDALQRVGPAETKLRFIELLRNCEMILVG